MPDGAYNEPPSPTALLRLREERRLVREAYGFLDEKRLLLAAEVLRQTQAYESEMQAFHELHRRAATALREALLRHGLDGLEVYPAPASGDAGLNIKSRNFLGVHLLTAELQPGSATDAPSPINPSPEAERCTPLFQELVSRATALAARSGNLHRLLNEYHRTERRARALADVILPELEAGLNYMAAQLEEADQEDIVRVRLGARSRTE
ncbi:V-type ATP synthase subunit D [Thermithiobacillus plumbiphilus]|uniref:V-type ATP synthase subunit D n=1 Tax=Thermithiobacillus plumbiphilus TaxID=1729899 RepID=A0ABU9D8C4_9PROT